ncbi:hypothetical protein JZ751_010953 [Albula glossodonta]|uniref:Uncharacterized protein n=1 Tax=Albula glossodonta TaxID=121402 RepID=A0A8T2NVY0_9TELE|nr:hypothetical protein JZ751_010953 [Albula glossodonta]
MAQDGLFWISNPEYRSEAQPPLYCPEVSDRKCRRALIAGEALLAQTGGAALDVKENLGKVAPFLKQNIVTGVNVREVQGLAVSGKDRFAIAGYCPCLTEAGVSQRDGVDSKKGRGVGDERASTGGRLLLMGRHGGPGQRDLS